MDPSPLLITDEELPKISRTGRPKGAGCNMRLLNRMKVGQTVWDVPRHKMDAIRASAWRLGVRISTVFIPETGLFAIKKIGEKTK